LVEETGFGAFDADYLENSWRPSRDHLPIL